MFKIMWNVNKLAQGNLIAHINVHDNPPPHENVSFSQGNKSQRPSRLSGIVEV